MPQNLLEQLRKYTVVVADTGDINAMEKFRPTDATTNPSLITTAAQMPQYQPIVDGVILDARKELGEARMKDPSPTSPFKASPLHSAKKILEDRSGPRLDRGRRPPLVRHRSDDREGPLASSRNTKSRHWPRARADQDRLDLGRHPRRRGSREGRHPLQPDAALRPPPGHRRAEAGVTLVSPFVGRILDWYKKDTGKDYKGADDPGVQSVTQIYNYYKKFGYKTEVMGASFRNIGEITRTRRMRSADDLAATARRARKPRRADLPRKLDPATAKNYAD